MILVTGGAGFIGSNFILDWLTNSSAEGVVNLDKMTYAGNLQRLESLEYDQAHVFVKGDITNHELVSSLLQKYQIRAVVNFAAESHVDRSIQDPSNFIQTNIVGTFHLLEALRAYWLDLPLEKKRTFRFLHVSTDEVYGSLGSNEPAFSETHCYAPNSPYSASKAASNHLVKAWHHTYGLPVISINCSNNYGPYQLPEKLIPLVIRNALSNKPLPIYGDGQQIRDWLYVKDHCAAIRRVLEVGRVGEIYNVGGLSEKKNIDVVKKICSILDELKPKVMASYADQIIFVKDRPGHDQRYAIDITKIQRELGWRPVETFDIGIRKTVQWYIDNQTWVNSIEKYSYHDWNNQEYP